MTWWGWILIGGAGSAGYLGGAWMSRGRELNAIRWATRERERADVAQVENVELRRDLARWQDERLGL